MRAAVLRAFNEPLTIEELAVEAPHAGEVLVEVAASGICGSDLKALAGKSPVTPHLPLILGHESAGVVSAVGAGVTSVRPGDHVLVAMTAPCGACGPCRAGRVADWACTGPTRATIMGLMPDGTTRLRVRGDVARPFIGVGSFASHVVVPEQMLVPVRADVPLDVVCLLACAVVTGVGAVLNTARVRPGSTVAVVGCGGVGLNVVQGARLAGATTIIAVDVVKEKLALAAEFGATHPVVADDVTAAILSVVPGGVDYAFDATGVPSVLSAAFDATCDGGVTVMVGSPPADSRIEISPQKLFMARTLRGCTGGDTIAARDLPMLADLYADGRLRLDELVSERVALDDINAAIERVRTGTIARAVVVP